MKEKLSVILIAHNEEQVIGKMIGSLLENYNNEILEILVVDDASFDDTSLIVRSWSSRNHKVKLISRVSPCGVGRALKAGFINVHPLAEYVLTMDSDFVRNIKEVRNLIDFLEQNEYDGVIGSRFLEGSRLELYPFVKKLMNRSFHMLVKVLFGIKQHDLTNNFKLYRASIFRSMPWKSDGFAMNAETGILPILYGYHIGEVAVSWTGRDSQMGKSKFRLFSSGWSYFLVIIYAWRFRQMLTRRMRSGRSGEHGSYRCYQCAS